MYQASADRLCRCLGYADHAEEWLIRGLSGRAPEKLLGEGSIRSIGLSNFNTVRIEALMRETDVVPAINQIELHPYNVRADLHTDTVLKWKRDAVDAPRDRTIGISAALRCETVQDFDDLTTLLQPRLPTVAEQVWALRPAPWSEFRESLATQSRYWYRLDIAYMETTDVDWSRTLSRIRTETVRANRSEEQPDGTNNDNYHRKSEHGEH